MGKVLLKGILFAFGAAFVFFPAAAAAPVASVGGGEVTEQDIADWRSAQACYGEGALTSRKAAFMRMYEATILEELLGREAGRRISRADYDRETARIDAETRAPDILACIKRYFGGDARRYERVFVRPILAQRFFREYVKDDPLVQARARALNGAVRKDIDAGKGFRETGATRGVAWSTAAYSLQEDTAAAPSPDPRLRWSPFEAEFINSYLKDLKPGGTRAIEDEAAFRTVRLTGFQNGKYYFETLTVPKLGAEEYLRGAKKLPAAINDAELRDWVAGIKGNPIIVPAGLEPTGK